VKIYKASSHVITIEHGNVKINRHSLHTNITNITPSATNPNASHYRIEPGTGED
jgi:hypothetical protein